MTLEGMTTREEILAVVLLALDGALTGLAVHGGWFDYNAAIGASIGAAVGLLVVRFSRGSDTPVTSGGERKEPRAVRFRSPPQDKVACAAVVATGHRPTSRPHAAKSHIRHSHPPGGAAFATRAARRSLVAVRNMRPHSSSRR